MLQAQYRVAQCQCASIDPLGLFVFALNPQKLGSDPVVPVSSTFGIKSTFRPKRV